MALRPPGSASKVQLLLSSLWTIAMMLGFIAGHLILIVYAYVHFDQQAGMEVLVEQTGIPSAVLWIAVAISFALDIWIWKGGKQDKKKASQR